MCKHLSQIGDSNGLSCMACGVATAGYGHRGHAGACIHNWHCAADAAFCICTWCGELQPNPSFKQAAVPAPYTVCRQCGCTNEDACVHPKYDSNCFWVEPDLCSYCKYTPGEAARFSILYEAEAATEGAFCD